MNLFSATTTYSFVVWDFDHKIPRVKPEPVVKEDDKTKIAYKKPEPEEVSYIFTSEDRALYY